ncbi:presqualene diphosphate synthase HpnD [Acidocella sp.]|uniref:presqualene diphosphate synthase HpnD n=1 Tax=Acidocella sp. TaxID=50710 RepID=UPI00260DFBE3|nr:presqualene diphosphate synthase HpnD [Acidocella sp.]
MTPADAAFVTALTKASGSSFYLGMKSLPPARRHGMYAIYAFCRVVDDIADEEGRDFATKQTALEAWRRRIRRLYAAGETDGPITRALASVVHVFGVHEEDFIAVIDGMEMDAGAPIIAPSLAEFDLYCDRVASAVGRLSVPVFGDASAKAREVAYFLGRALQITNILRDVPEDAARGRLYLPREILARHHVPLQPQAALDSPALPKACSEIAMIAEGYFTRALSAMQDCNQPAMRPARLMAESYHPLLKTLQHRNFAYAKGRIRLPRWRKFVLLLRFLLPL